MIAELYKKLMEAEEEVEMPSEEVMIEEKDLLPPPSPAPEEDPKLTEAELFRLRAYEAESKAANLEANIKLIQRELFLRQIDPDGKLAAFDREIQSHLHESAKSREEYDKALKAVGERLKVDMQKHVYDDETGELQFLE